MAEKVATILLGWNDGKLLPEVLDSLINQTYPHRVFYVDDGSTDNSVEIVKSYGIEDISLLERKKRVYGGFPILAENVNTGLRMIEGQNFDYFIVTGGDIVWERDYVRKITSRFQQDPIMVIASGAVEGEYTVESAPRGAGRTIKTSWFNCHIGKFPHSFLWESYPVFKAQSLGYHTRRFTDIHMKALRPTRGYKPIYGYAMRELGYLPLYAYARCFLGFLRNREGGVQMFRTYRTNLEPLDPELAEWIRRYQTTHIRTVLKPSQLVKTLIK